MSLQGYEGMPTMSYVKAGQWVRRHHPQEKWLHISQADHYLHQASRYLDDYHREVTAGLTMLGSRGVDPGPLISGVVSDKFSDTFKDRLRTLLRAVNNLRDAAMGHYAAAGKRITTYRAAHQRYVGSGGYGS